MSGWIAQLPIDEVTAAIDRLHRGQAMKILIEVGS